MCLVFSKWKKCALIITILIIPFNLLIISVYNNEFNSHSCTIFTVSRDGNSFFANNEDEGLQHGRIWFYPAYGDNYGKLLFGYAIRHDVDIYVGGLNDQGLCFDMNMVSRTQMNADPNKLDFEGAFFLKMLEECATVEDVRNWTQLYNLYLLTWQQVHIADTKGDAMVIGLDSEGNFHITNKTGDYIISTNSFNLAQTKTDCWRYDLAEDMLNTMPDLSLDYCRDILDATQLTSTMYSYIVNLNNGLIYLYSHKDFEHFAVIDSFREIGKAYHSYDIQTLVMQHSGVIFPGLDDLTKAIILISSFAIISLILFCCFIVYRTKIRLLLKRIKL